ncbi:MAG: DUF2304 domain-containing protein [Patescibacteria group bacterium]|jgi:hypothetical protein
MIGIQIGAILFVIWMTYFSYLHYRRKEFGIYEYIFWQILWIGLVVVVIYPHSVNFILNAFSINRTFDFVVIVGIIVLFGITFRNYVLLRRMERKLENFVRQDALRDKNDKE